MNHKFKKSALTTLKSVIVYAIVWTVMFAVSFLINKVAGDATTASIHGYIKYAGYPLLGIGWGIGWIIAGAFYLVTEVISGVIYLLKITSPYSLYLIGIGLVAWLLFAVFKALTTPTVVSREAQEAQARHQETMRVVKEAMLLKSISDMSRD